MANDNPGAQNKQQGENLPEASKVANGVDWHALYV